MSDKKYGNDGVTRMMAVEVVTDLSPEAEETIRQFAIDEGSSSDQMIGLLKKECSDSFIHHYENQILRSAGGQSYRVINLYIAEILLETKDGDLVMTPIVLTGHPDSNYSESSEVVVETIPVWRIDMN